METFITVKPMDLSKQMLERVAHERLGHKNGKESKWHQTFENLINAGKVNLNQDFILTSSQYISPYLHDIGTIV